MSAPPDSPTPAAEGTPTPKVRADILFPGIPMHLVPYAQAVDDWMQMNGHDDYEFGPVASRKLVHSLRAQLTSTQQALVEAQRANQRLNRRAQMAEGIIARAGIVEGRPQGSKDRTLGRALANYAASQYQRENEELKSQLATLRQQNEALRDEIGELRRTNLRLHQSLAQFTGNA